MPMDHPYFWFGGMWLIPVLLLAAVVWVSYLVVRQGNVGQPRESPRAGGAETALEILEKRYARGEVNREEFQQMKKDLS